MKSHKGSGTVFWIQSADEKGDLKYLQVSRFRQAEGIQKRRKKQGGKGGDFFSAFLKKYYPNLAFVVSGTELEKHTYKIKRTF